MKPGSWVFLLVGALVAASCGSDDDGGGQAGASGVGGAGVGGSAGSAAGGSGGTGGAGGSIGGSAGSIGGGAGSTAGSGGDTDASAGSAGSSAGGSAGVGIDGSAGTGSGGSAGSATGGNAGAGGSAGSGAGGAAGTTGSGGTGGNTNWTTFCGAQSAPILSGQIFAPNGVDPAPFATAYVPYVINPIPPGVACDLCSGAQDPVYVVVTTGVDGKFSLDLAGVPYSASVDLAVRKGRFRKVTQHAPACGQTLAVPKAATTLPGTSAQGDKPKLAVGSGNVDHLDQVVNALGIPEFDCYEGRTSNTSNCPAAQATQQKVLALLKNATLLNSYNLLFLSCAPNIWSSYSAADRATITVNLKAWVSAGGRLIVTDHSYDYVSQTFPNDIVWHGPAGPPWQIGTLSGAGANVGLAPSGSNFYVGTINDPNITAWLKLPQINVTSAPSVNITGWLTPWTVQKSLPTTTTNVVHGSVNWEYPAGSGTKTNDYPLTSQFIVNKCGRVIFSSYHTTGTSASLEPQERILEYLMLDVASCLVD